MQDFISLVPNIDRKFIVDIHSTFTSIALDVIGQIAYSYDFKATKSLFTGELNADKDLMAEMSLVLSHLSHFPEYPL